MRKNHKSRLAIIGLVAVTSLTLAACSSDDDDASSAGSDTEASEEMTPSEEPSESPMDDATMTQFGEGCAAVPTDGAGSFAGMAMDPVATAASNNPVLSTLVTAVGAAGLGDTLNSAQDITVFAPANSAFEAADQATVAAALADPSGLLTTVLTYHVVGETLTPEDLAGTHTTLQGGTLEVSGSGEDFTVNGSSNVICGNVQTANATVYIIDGLLLPAA